MNFPPADHPFWRWSLTILLIFAATCLLGIVLWKNAANFDETEWRAIGEWVTGFVALIFGFQSAVNRLSKSGKD